MREVKLLKREVKLLKQQSTVKKFPNDGPFVLALKQKIHVCFTLNISNDL